MSEDLNDVITFYVRKLRRLGETTIYSIDEEIQKGPFGLTDDQKEQLRKELQSRFDITQERGASVKTDYTSWFLGRQGRKEDIDFYYWDRLREYLLGEHIIPPRVVSRLDSLSDEILDYCGNPDDNDDWSRRGMVMGHVQSGKTTNYTALICKAADAGYKVVILLAGLTNPLRSQTQQRLDETFIGKKSIFRKDVDEPLPILKYAKERRFPHFGTTRDHDFKRSSAQTYGVSLGPEGPPHNLCHEKKQAYSGEFETVDPGSDTRRTSALAPY